jgi:hypothetical protein
MREPYGVLTTKPQSGLLDDDFRITRSARGRFCRSRFVHIAPARSACVSYIESKSSVWSIAVAFSLWRAHCSLQAEAILASKV